MPPSSEYIWITCQLGAERAVKHELAVRWPAFRFAYSRPGFLTFKLPLGHGLSGDFDLGCVFARAHGFSLGKAEGSDPAERAASAWKLADARTIDRVHVWPRDARAAGDHGYTPSLTPECCPIEDALRQAAPRTLQATVTLSPVADSPPALHIEPAEIGQTILDCLLLDEGVWWIGWHTAHNWQSRRPGGLCAAPTAAGIVSRAYHKMQEALDWSGLPVRPGQQVAEIGCAPGGSSQALLERGLHVLGVDPAEVDPAVLADPRFTHVRKRGHEVRRREFRKTRWLTADMNVAPQYALDTVEAIVNHDEVRVQGLLLTLKLLDWSLADEAPAYLERVRSWGYAHVQARQLQHNRREICLAAWR